MEQRAGLGVGSFKQCAAAPPQLETDAAGNTAYFVCDVSATVTLHCVVAPSFRLLALHISAAHVSVWLHLCRMYRMSERHCAGQWQHRLKLQFLLPSPPLHICSACVSLVVEHVEASACWGRGGAGGGGGRGEGRGG
jgi:hypothetical protein